MTTDKTPKTYGELAEFNKVANYYQTATWNVMEGDVVLAGFRRLSKNSHLIMAIEWVSGELSEDVRMFWAGDEIIGTPELC